MKYKNEINRIFFSFFLISSSYKIISSISYIIANLESFDNCRACYALQSCLPLNKF